MAEINPSASAPSITAAPDRKVILAAIAGAVIAVIMALLKRYVGDAMPPEISTLVTVLVTAAVAYLVPSTKQEVANRTTNDTVKLANADINNQQTTAKVVTAEESDAATKIDVATGMISRDAVAWMAPLTPMP